MVRYSYNNHQILAQLKYVFLRLLGGLISFIINQAVDVANEGESNTILRTDMNFLRIKW